MKRPGHARGFAAAILLMAASAFGFSPTELHASENAVPGSADQIQAESSLFSDQKSEAGSSKPAPTLIESLGREVLADAKYVITSPLRIDARSALLLGGMAAAIGGLMVVDDDIQEAFQKNRTDTNNDIAERLETVGDGTSVLIGNLGLIGTGWWFREYEAGDKLLRTALVSLEAQVFTEAIAGLTKFVVGRERPTAGRGKDSYHPFSDFDRSFPSSHTARVFAVAAVFADRYEQPIPFVAYTTATLIGLSRIHQNRHFASDVLAGAALGLAMGKVLSWRHRDTQPGLTVLPFLPTVSGGLGLTVRYTF